MPLTSGRFQPHGKPCSRSSPIGAELTKKINDQIMQRHGIRPLPIGLY